MITGHVPTGRKANSWIGNITTREQYNVLVSSGLCWVMFPDTPLSWAECQEKFQHLQNLNLTEEKE